jgi:hypothetical protein
VDLRFTGDGKSFRFPLRLTPLNYLIIILSSTILDRRRDQKDTVATISYCLHPCLRQGPTDCTSFHRLDSAALERKLQPTKVRVRLLVNTYVLQDSVVFSRLRCDQLFAAHIWFVVESAQTRAFF